MKGTTWHCLLKNDILELTLHLFSWNLWIIYNYKFIFKSLTEAIFKCTIKWKTHNIPNNHNTSQLCMNQLWHSCRVCQPTLPPLLSSSSQSFNVQTAFVTGQSWQCTSLCRACFPSLFIGGRLGVMDCRRDIEIHFTFPTNSIANALKCSSV